METTVELTKIHIYWNLITRPKEGLFVTLENGSRVNNKDTDMLRTDHQTKIRNICDF